MGYMRKQLAGTSRRARNKSSPSGARFALVIFDCGLQRYFLRFLSRLTVLHSATTPPATPRRCNVDAILTHVFQQQIDGRRAGEKKNKGDEYSEHSKH